MGLYLTRATVQDTTPVRCPRRYLYNSVEFIRLHVTKRNCVGCRMDRQTGLQDFFKAFSEDGKEGLFHHRRVLLVRKPFASRIVINSIIPVKIYESPFVFSCFTLFEFKFRLRNNITHWYALSRCRCYFVVRNEMTTVFCVCVFDSTAR